MAVKAIVDPALPGDDLEYADQRVTWSGRSWQDYETLDAMRGDSATPRLTYLDGELELMSPSVDHERIGWFLGRLLETYMDALGVVYRGRGTWTLKLREQVGLEPDGCWILGELAQRERPDLALEVQWTRGGIGKLEIYRRFGVPEVWMWRAGEIHIHALTSTGYERRERSTLLPEVDVALLVRYLAEDDSSTTLQVLRAELARLARA